MNADVHAIETPSGVDYLLALARGARRILGGALLAGAVAVGCSYLIAPTFTASTVVLPPAQAQSMAAQALSSLGALASIAGGATGGRTALDQYVALLNSTTVADRMIERFDLMKVYDVDLRMEARREFWKSLRVTAGRRDGLITIEVDDASPERVQQMAVAMVDEFRKITGEIAVTEAQQRKRFFEKRQDEARRQLEQAQGQLQASGLAPGSLKAEPKAAVESYAKLKAELAAAQARLQVVAGTFTPQAAEYRQQQALVNSLQGQVRSLESSSAAPEDGSYLSRYRDYKYQEALFELYSKQLEVARVDEGREGGLLQVVDVAQVPEKKSKPKRAILGLMVSVAVGFLLLSLTLIRFHLSHVDIDGQLRAKWRALGPTLLGRG